MSDEQSKLYAPQDARDDAETIRTLRTQLADAIRERDEAQGVARILGEEVLKLRDDLAKVTVELSRADREIERLNIVNTALDESDENDSLRLLIEAKDNALNSGLKYFVNHQHLVSGEPCSRCVAIQQMTDALCATPDSLTEELRSLREDKELLEKLERLCGRAITRDGTTFIIWDDTMFPTPLRDAIRNAKEGTPSPPPM